ncbi:hypothetical protein WT49_21785 [Burkholderia territorii]|nr:hypothetical protein WT49_21785 [Burkholderia territorii]KWE47810.1 hypothetical protein WT50_05825 [Burkholderia territorii]KWE51830.1 hypothetical protein WT51_10130 [Burkholderia territorii]
MFRGGESAACRATHAVRAMQRRCDDEVALPPADLVSAPGNAQAAREDDVLRRDEKSMTRRDGLNCRAA